MRRRFPYFRGRRVEISTVESDFEYYTAGLYIGNYALHFLIMSFVLCMFDTKLQTCQIPITRWLEISGLFYLLATLSSMSLVVYMRRRSELNVRVIDMVVLECIFIEYNSRTLPLMTLLSIDLLHGFLTIKGSNIFFKNIG